jgi:hypothetical protein
MVAEVEASATDGLRQGLLSAMDRPFSQPKIVKIFHLATIQVLPPPLLAPCEAPPPTFGNGYWFI